MFSGVDEVSTESDAVSDLGANGAKYLPAYLNDLAAVRLHLDSKNDNKDLKEWKIALAVFF